MILTGSRFEALMTLLFGRAWHSEAARRFGGLDRKTMQRWAKKGPPAERRTDIFRMVEHHLAEIGTWYDQLREDAAEV